MACGALEVVGRAALPNLDKDGKVLQSRRVQNKYAIMERTYCFDGTRVVSADGKPLGKAKIVVDATKAGTGLGYTSLGVIGGSDVNEYIQKNGAAPPGQAAFRSAATVGLRWEVPLVGTIINVKPQWLQELPIIVDKDGLANCRGGVTCRFVPLE